MDWHNMSSDEEEEAAMQDGPQLQPAPAPPTTEPVAVVDALGDENAGADAPRSIEVEAAAAAVAEKQPLVATPGGAATPGSGASSGAARKISKTGLLDFMENYAPDGKLKEGVIAVITVNPSENASLRGKHINIDGTRTPIADAMNMLGPRVYMATGFGQDSEEHALTDYQKKLLVGWVHYVRQADMANAEAVCVCKSGMNRSGLFAAWLQLMLDGSVAEELKPVNSLYCAIIDREDLDVKPADLQRPSRKRPASTGGQRYGCDNVAA